MTAAVIQRKWLTVTEVAELLGFWLSKTKILIAMGQVRTKDQEKGATATCQPR